MCTAINKLQSNSVQIFISFLPLPHQTDDFFVPQHRDLAGLFEYRDPPSLDDIVIHAGPPANVGEGNEDYPLFDLDDLF